MSDKTIFDIAEGFGLNVEHVPIPDNDSAFKIFKGVNPIFVGTESAVREFLSTYEFSRPGLYEASMIGYKE
ncbi:MAG: hypothetical protein PSX80_03815 [bacterium]|nr:hypothetical protein [bacterium]